MKIRGDREFQTRRDFVRWNDSDIRFLNQKRKMLHRKGEARCTIWGRGQEASRREEGGCLCSWLRLAFSKCSCVEWMKKWVYELGDEQLELRGWLRLKSWHLWGGERVWHNKRQSWEHEWTLACVAEWKRGPLAPYSFFFHWLFIFHICLCNYSIHASRVMVKCLIVRVSLGTDNTEQIWWEWIPATES